MPANLTHDVPALTRLAARLHEVLPQTQCTRCGYPDCRAYADAIAFDNEAVNRCLPGGSEGVARLAALAGRPVEPLDPTCGIEGPRHMAVIDEAWCIGCTLCLDACPTDAILGTTKRMHTVIEPHCTGCELCIPACPVDCIALEDVTPGRSGWQAWSKTQADAALARYAVRSLRVGAGRSDIEKSAEGVPATVDPAPSVRTAVDDAAAERKRAVVAAALARARDARTPRP